MAFAIFPGLFPGKTLPLHEFSALELDSWEELKDSRKIYGFPWCQNRTTMSCCFFFFFSNGRPYGIRARRKLSYDSAMIVSKHKMYVNFCSLYGYTGLGMFLKGVLTQNIGSLKMAICWMIKVLWQQLDWDEFSFESYIYFLVPFQSRREILV